ncbi:transcriptional regulator [Bordetella avium]|uniref:XRE family transcriptional regulator n=1 Tax=Bordetella avium TaxID=521 RepID=UPI000FD7ABD1|nr:XRE family transcriptional regulator [Bordetella avium]AZY48755.1 transcriptional regulator [Bordetella avium]
MKGFRNYTAPSTTDLARLKADLAMTGNDLADLSGVSDNRQWRKYTGGTSPWEMSASMLFLLAARLTLPESEVEAVLAKMREIGAEFDFTEPPTA